MIYLALVVSGLCWAMGAIWFAHGIIAFVVGIAATSVLPLLIHRCSGWASLGAARSARSYLIGGGWCVLSMTVSFASLPFLMRMHNWPQDPVPRMELMTEHLFYWTYGTSLAAFTALAAWRLLHEARHVDARHAILMNLAFVLPLAGLQIAPALPFYALGLLLVAGMAAAWCADDLIASRYVEAAPRSWILGGKP